MILAAPEKANLPNPVPMPGGFRVPEEVPRQVFCQHHSSCLNHGARLGWPGLSCEHCQAYLPQQWSPEEILQEAEACRCLIECVLRDLPRHIEGLAQARDLYHRFDRGEDKLLIVSAAALRLGRSENQIRRLFKQDKIRGIRLTERGIRLYESSVEAYRIEMQG